MYYISLLHGRPNIVTGRQDAIRIGAYTSLDMAKRTFRLIRQTLNVDYAPGSKLQCNFVLDGRHYSIAITGELFDTVENYTPFVGV